MKESLQKRLDAMKLADPRRKSSPAISGYVLDMQRQAINKKLAARDASQVRQIAQPNRGTSVTPGASLTTQQPRPGAAGTSYSNGNGNKTLQQRLNTIKQFVPVAPESANLLQSWQVKPQNAILRADDWEPWQDGIEQLPLATPGTNQFVKLSMQANNQPPASQSAQATGQNAQAAGRNAQPASQSTQAASQHQPKTVKEYRDAAKELKKVNQILSEDIKELKRTHGSADEIAAMEETWRTNNRQIQEWNMLADQMEQAEQQNKPTQSASPAQPAPPEYEEFDPFDEGDYDLPDGHEISDELLQEELERISGEIADKERSMNAMQDKMDVLYKKIFDQSSIGDYGSGYLANIDAYNQLLADYQTESDAHETLVGKYSQFMDAYERKTYGGGTPVPAGSQPGQPAPATRPSADIQHEIDALSNESFQIKMQMDTAIAEGDLTSVTALGQQYKDTLNQTVGLQAELTQAQEFERLQAPGGVVKSGEGSWIDAALDVLQSGLDLGGFIPGVGLVPDAVNSIISFLRGDLQAAAISLISILPAGDIAKLGKAGDIADLVGKYGDEILEIARGLMNNADTLTDAKRMASVYMAGIVSGNLDDMAQFTAKYGDEVAGTLTRGAGEATEGIAKGADNALDFADDAAEGVGKGSKELKYGSNAKSTEKLSRQMDNRGWTKESVQDTVDNSYTTRKSTSKPTGNSATVYYNKDGSYVVVDDVTGEIVQVSDANDPTWIPDDTIVDPYIPEGE
jgi:hypothetical protein